MELAARLAAAGFVAAEDEAAELLACAGDDPARLEALLARRLTGEPLAWITGRTRFCGLDLIVHPGVYVPRWHSEALALRAAARLPPGGIAIDVCCGSGALAAVLRARRPRARVLATDIDPRAVACARANGVQALAGDLFAPLPPGLAADVVVGVVPFVPSGELALLHRDALAFEPALAYDGGGDGMALLRRAAEGARTVLRRGGALLLELGAPQYPGFAAELARLGYGETAPIHDEEGDLRGVEARVDGV